MRNKKPEKYYIGLAANFHDPAIALVNESGQIVFAEATERFLQSKRALSSASDPIFFVNKILESYPMSDYEIGFNWAYYKSLYGHLLASAVVYGMKNYIRMFKWVARIMKLKDPDEITSLIGFHHISHFSCLTMSGASFRRALKTEFDLPYKRVHYFDHHLCHAYYAFYTLPCTEALVLVLDGAGDESKAFSIYDVKEHHFKQLYRNDSAASMGDFYGALTSWCGFSALGGEQWKVMGMAPYGKKNEALYADLKDWMYVDGVRLRVKKKLQFQVINETILKKGYDAISRYDVAYTGQLYYEEIVTELISNIYKKWPHENFILTGGCALNSAYNGKIHLDTPFKNVFIPSAPGDDGCSVGAALLDFKKHRPEKNIPHAQTDPYLGFEINEQDILFMQKYSGYTCQKMSYEEIYTTIAKQINEGKIIGWVQGRAEFGPRALGNRSILANPCLEGMKDKINENVKFREEFRPFAPSVMEEHANDYFENYLPTPYMERVLAVKKDKREIIKAVNHVDNTGRLQTVNKTNNLHFYNLINEFYKLSGVPVVLNTSFNVMGKPIVNSVQDMAAVFTNSGLDLLVINDYVFKK